MIFLLLVAGILITARLSWRIHNTILSPWAVYLIVWLGMFALYALGWVDYISIHLDTWVLLAASLAMYCLGAFIALGGWRRGALRLTMPPVKSWFDGVDLGMYNKFQIVITVLGLIGTIGYFLAIDKVFGLSTLVSDPGLIRSLQGEDQFIDAFYWWKFLFYMNWLAIPLGVARIALQRRQTPRWIYLALVFQFAINLVLVLRSQLLFALFLAVFIVSAAFNKSLRKWEPVLAGAVVVITVLYFVVAGEVLGKTYDYLISLAGSFHGPDAFRPLAGFYTYVTGNIPAFQAYMRENELASSYGLFQILPAAKLLSSLGLIGAQLPQEVGDFVLIPFPFNTYTYLNVFYLDWGMLGVLIGPFLFGFLGNWLYRYTCMLGRVWHVVLMALIVHACLSSIGTNVLISTPQWEFVLALIVLAVLTRKSPADARYTATLSPKTRRM